MTYITVFLQVELCKIGTLQKKNRKIMKVYYNISNSMNATPPFKFDWFGVYEANMMTNVNA